MSLLPSSLLKMRTKFEERLDIGNSRTRDALARLIKDHEDAVALIAVFEENREAITAAVTHWLGDESKYEEAAKNVLLKIGEHAHDFNPCVDEAREWVWKCAYRECRRMRLEIEAASAPYN
jgi:DNA-directed RNA polymerase specialized sigma24 family protein